MKTWQGRGGEPTIAQRSHTAGANRKPRPTREPITGQLTRPKTTVQDTGKTSPEQTGSSAEEGAQTPRTHARHVPRTSVGRVCFACLVCCGCRGLPRCWHPSDHTAVDTFPHCHFATFLRRHVDTSAHLHICTSAHLHIYLSANLHIHASTHLDIYTRRHLHIDTSTLPLTLLAASASLCVRDVPRVLCTSVEEFSVCL